MGQKSWWLGSRWKQYKWRKVDSLEVNLIEPSGPTVVNWKDGSELRRRVNLG